MYAYFLTQTANAAAYGQRRHWPAASNPESPALHEVFIPAPGELTALRAALARAHGVDPLRQGLLRMVAPEVLSAQPALPPLLGAAAGHATSAAPEPGCLHRQLQAMRAAWPGRRHFRLLLANAFGGALGDTLMGLTAFRRVLVTLREVLPVVQVDVLLGWQPDTRLQRLFAELQGFDRLLSQGPSLAEMDRYQGVFEAQGLLGLPGYGQVPMADWYLGWMGLDPAQVAPEDKRNRFTVDPALRAALEPCLPRHAGPVIVFNPRASTALRAMPVPAQQRLLPALLEQWPEACIWLLQPLALEHPRVHDVSALADSLDGLAAVMSCAHALLGVDTFTQHLADALAVPALTLYTSVDPALYAQYPLVDPLLLPGARKLPAWGRMKLKAAEWPALEAAYAAAWGALDATTVVEALQRVMARKAASPDRFAARRGDFVHATQAQRREPVPAVAAPACQREDALASYLEAVVQEVAAATVQAGDTVVMLGGGAQPAMALRLAARVGPQGQLLIVEPRRELHPVLGAALAAAGWRHAQVHLAWPEATPAGTQMLPRLCIDDEHGPLQLANTRATDMLPAWPLDRLALPRCHLLLVMAPLPPLAVLQGASATLDRHRPAVVAGPFALSSAAALESFFDGRPDWQHGLRRIGDAARPDLPPQHGVLVATPGSGSGAPAQSG